MNALLALPLEWRLLALFVGGLGLGGLLNLAIYRLSWDTRWTSPWLRGPEHPQVNWSARIPVVGWWFLRHESSMHGVGFWVRPMVLELATGILLAWLYWWEVDQQRLLIPPLLAPLPLDNRLAFLLHSQYAAHVALIALMIVASFIDVDEKIIPDTVTVPGTLLGLVLATLVPLSLLPDVIPGEQGKIAVENVRFVQLASPNGWPPLLTARRPESLALAVGCYALWCAGLLPRRWRGRRGVAWAWRLFWAGIVREPFSYLVLALGLAGAAGIGSVWWWGAESWQGLLTALVGLATGGGLVWAVRFIGTNVLGREAMGFGDVTLMSMIGTFVGWQACLVIFFLAPFFGLLVGAVQWLLHRESEIFYGPFLCLATLTVIIRWAATWDWALPLFAVGWLVPMAVVVCLVLMAVLLSGWHGLLRLFGR